MKFSSEGDPGFRNDFVAEASLPLIHGAPAISHNINSIFAMLFCANAISTQMQLQSCKLYTCFST